MEEITALPMDDFNRVEVNFHGKQVHRAGFAAW